MDTAADATAAIDQVRADYAAGRTTRDDALTQIRTIVDVTEAGAADLLDDPDTATARFLLKPGQALAADSSPWIAHIGAAARTEIWGRP